MVAESATPLAEHPPEGDLFDFARGLLAPARSDAVEVHVARCNRCAAKVAAADDDGFIRLIKDAGNSKLDESPLKPGDRPTEFFARQGPLDLDPLPPELRNHPRYKIEEPLATGAMGDVYLATDKVLAQRVVVKVLKPRWAGNPVRLKRFLQEARVAQRLRHANIARVLHSAPAGESAYIVMEFVDGETLAEIVGRRGPLPIEEACGLVAQAAAGLAYAARQRAIHRDVKPENLMFDDETKQLKVVDFGLGRLVDEQRSGSRLTREGEILGTVNYMAPEQAADSRSADTRSDVYSLGCVLFFLLAGFPPFRGRSPLEVLTKHAQEAPPSLAALRPEIPAEIAALVARMLAKSPLERPQSLAEIVPELVSTTAKSGASKAPLVGDGLLNRLPTELIAAFRSPAVVLPVLTALGCILWLWCRWR
jgi:serine/threonine protein kinase